MAPCFIVQALQNRMCELVDMNEIKFHRFTATRCCLGTMNLNGCTAVLILSPTAAMLAHISPRPSGEDPYEATGDDHVSKMMNRMNVGFNEQQHSFSQGAYSIVIYAEFRGEVALYDQAMIISERLRSWGIAPQYVPYEVMPASQHRGAKGTVLVDGRGQLPVVYVEDQIVFF